MNDITQSQASGQTSGKADRQSSGQLSGQMMTQPLLVSSLLTHAARHFSDREIVSIDEHRATHRYTWKCCAERAARLADAVENLGIAPGDRIATLAWNGYRHLELYYAISGSGRVMHTINPRLHLDQLAFIINDAEDELVFFEKSFLPIVKELAPRCKRVKAFVLLGAASDVTPEEGLAGMLFHEDLIARGRAGYQWPVLDEHSAASLCYTSGTTGNPKGVLYSHRASILHAFASVMPDGFNLSGRDCIMPAVPMFHVNAWGLPYAAALVGAKLVLPGSALDGKSLYGLCETEGVTFSAGVPTVWQGLLNHVASMRRAFSTLQRVVVGGSACPPAMMDLFKEGYGIDVVHAFGMTELSPLGTVCTLKDKHLALPPNAQREILQTQGRVLYGIDMKVVDDDGKELPWDGKSAGHLNMRGHWVIDSYFRKPPGSALQDGWFATGDIAVINADGYLRITDRIKDVIKSGGEWIGSIDLENIALEHPEVQQAACIGVPHPVWSERPLLVVVKKPEATVDKAGIIGFYTGRIAKWWTPEDVVFVEALPVGGTGKILKNRLREQFRDYLLPEAGKHD
ncbi:3-(methylthio)propionyl-CoA ligase [Herbaspirillum sp. GCM10030257]|uniref:3-(methylthio)propionyl-CoA ligase n=1 Tax=Herbaspirillum sp. GCM10030257 TaxID=3273393 RepID=UPI003622C2A6